MSTEKTTAQDLSAFLTLRIAPDLREKLAAIAQQNDRTVAAEIRRALRQYVEDRA